jgi:N-acyl-phosphatidylethanolamine-hydrolysing phospholipase D
LHEDLDAPPVPREDRDDVAALYAPHHDGRRFFNPWRRLPVRFADVLRWYRERPWGRPAESPAPRVANDGASLRAHEPGLALTWVGHATFAIHHADTVLLTDPHFGARALLPPRHVPPGLPIGAIPPAPLVVLSHNHYDHLDRWTVRRLPRDTRWRAPRGLASTLRGWGARDVVELDWWEERRDGEVGLTCLPVQHWSNRVTQPRNGSLWCGWMIELGGRRLFFAGDSGWFAGFAEYGRRFHPVDAALLPIGSYEPRWFMRYQHMNPEEAVAALQALGARHLVAMHWGTFVLTDEPLDEPPHALRRAAAARGVAPDRLAVLAVGERWCLP